jgi:murein DD-endopeptidase MepM/ murein hydrolase activator NlpD
MCEQGDVSYLEMLFSAKNFGDLVDKIEIIQEISQHDKNIFDKMEATRLEIEAARDEIAALKEEQENSKAELTSQKSALDKKQQEQKAYMKELENDAAAYQKVIDQADAAMESLRRSISGSLSTASRGRAYVGGEFTWPTPSCYYITSNFSPRRKNPVTGIYKRHTGTDIGAAYGASIVAANSGTVTLAGWNSGYGNCVVIDHGGGRATLYGHMSSIGVSKGQTVTKGQQIGLVGSTGNSTGPHLHFEILINGSAVDPMQYFN